ncbi:CwfJ C-terminus 1-domain-containing protein-like protein [Zychaea mexicana]|uniref:CwfJ C-terminus 1-domain-containing protein-like protein n=1 Tax=Zychaea mexicana TaxID=64656 RepID=UPI0022FDB466|nr:CwfJ C-terminus 1-domain-containing protein-like protein [Zychaea mexicana]KAI9490653.1 CwfJ C-terminus 1-domain-containing protein-like protein [Zychaea mexicana]
MTYFMTGDQPIPEAAQSRIDANDGEVCDNLYYLGKKGTLTTANGLKIAWLSGVPDNNGFTDEDVQALKMTKMPITAPAGVDILMTHLWPSGIENGSKAIQAAPANGSVTMAQLAAALKPRYYFAAAEGAFCEREPYKNVTGFGPPDERAVDHVTRFIGLGNFLNDTKQRWFYAFNMEPLIKSPEALTASFPTTTECPFTKEAIAAGKKRPHPEEDDSGSFFWGGQQNPKRQVESCWFCLANPKLEKHLIVSIGSELYATLAKGPLVSSQDKSGVPGGGHIILVPVTHYTTFNKVPAETHAQLTGEIEKYKNALRAMFAEYGQDMLVFELSRQSFMGHAHMQIVPVPKDKSDSIEATARQAAKQEGFELTDQVPTGPDVNFFKLELPNGKSLVHVLQPRERFNLQFGRLIAAKVLGHPEREDWKTCKQTTDEEKNDTSAFKDAFKKYDPTV